MSDFDPIPRLQQIAATIEESGSETFDAPATAAHYINCAIKEIERLRKERDEARKEVCELKSYNFEGKISPKAYAEMRKWDCYKEDGK